jgi:hypothetical protein
LNCGWPFHQAGNSAAPIEHGSLAFAKRAGGAGVVAVAEPRAVIGCEDQKGVIFKPQPLQCGDELADGPVDFGEDIREGTFAGFVLKLFSGEQRHVDHGVWQVKEEGAVAAGFDEGDSSFGVLSGEPCLLFGCDFRIDDVVVFKEWQVWPCFESFIERQMQDFGMKRPHIVTVWQPEVLVEAVLQRQERLAVAEVPFSEAGGGVALAAADFRDGGFSGVESISGFGPERSLNTDANVVAAGHEAGAGGGADGLGDIEIGKAAAGGGQLIQVGCEGGITAKGADVGVSHVIHIDQDHIRTRSGGIRRGWIERFVVSGDCAVSIGEQKCWQECKQEAKDFPWGDIGQHTGIHSAEGYDSEGGECDRSVDFRKKLQGASDFGVLRSALGAGMNDSGEFMQATPAAGVRAASPALSQTPGFSVE